MDFIDMSPQEIFDLAKPTPEYAELLEIWPPLRVNWSNPKEALSHVREMTNIANEQDEPDPAVEEKHFKVPARDGFENELRVFRPRKSSSPGPLIVLYHGGGCILGSPTMVAETSRQLVKRFGAIVAAPAYRLAPEHPFPASNNDTWDSFCWIAKNASTALQADVSKGFIIGGVSAGASMSIVIAHLARDAGIKPKLTGVWSACGSTRLRPGSQLADKYRERYLSREQGECIYNPLLSKDLQDLMRDCYQPDLNSKLFASMFWPDGDGHKNLPRLYLQVCGRDPSRDDALIFNDVVRREGVETRLDIYAGLPHCFWVALRDLPESKRWERETVEGFSWLLHP